MTAKLYTYPGNSRAYKALIAAKYSGFDIKVEPDFVFGETNRSEEFLKKFPAGKVPALETGDNKYIFESEAIAHYAGNDQLRGKNLFEQTQIQQWIHFCDSEIMPSAATWLYPVLGYLQYNKQATEKAKETLKTSLQILNDHLLAKTYLVGERITQADISISCTLLNLYVHLFEPSFRQSFGNVNRWFVTLVNQPQFKEVIGEVKLCETMAQFDPKKFEEMNQKSPKEKGSKGKEGKQEKKPKEDKKKEKPAKEEEEMDETEMILAAESKSKDPFEKYPKGKFVMDEFKRVYSNEEESVSIKHFWNTFDPEHYSIWYCEYLFPKELTLVFMSCNLISGMFQRLDKMRKNAFGSVALFGEDNNSTISGIWIWRGHDLAFKLCEDWQIDYESYSWKKLDASAPETKKLVDEYFSWSGDFDGKKFNQGKIFK